MTDLFVLLLGIFVPLSGSFVLVLGDRWSALFPCLLSVGLIMLLLWAGWGLHPSGFFVSPGGWMLLGGVAFVAAIIVRLFLVVWDRRTG